jgi:hypothetical protein
MGRHDCVILYNAANISEVEGSEEKIYPSTIIREEVGAIEESLREGGFSPLVLSVDHFSRGSCAGSGAGRAEVRLQSVRGDQQSGGAGDVRGRAPGDDDAGPWNATASRITRIASLTFRGSITRTKGTPMPRTTSSILIGLPTTPMPVTPRSGMWLVPSHCSRLVVYDDDVEWKIRFLRQSAFYGLTNRFFPIEHGNNDRGFYLKDLSLMYSKYDSIDPACKKICVAEYASSIKGNGGNVIGILEMLLEMRFSCWDAKRIRKELDKSFFRALKRYKNFLF